MAMRHYDLARPDTLPPFLTVTEVAAILACARSTAYELIASRQLPSISIGRALRVQTTDLLAWIAQTKNGPAA